MDGMVNALKRGRISYRPLDVLLLKNRRSDLDLIILPDIAVLSDEEIEFGRTNVNELPPDFIRYVKEELGKFAPIPAQCGETGCGKAKINDKIKRLKKYVDS